MQKCQRSSPSLFTYSGAVSALDGEDLADSMESPLQADQNDGGSDPSLTKVTLAEVN